MSKVSVATVWLDGCSGCHMSFLDMDERLIELAEKIELVYSPLVDRKDFPEKVDVTIVEGAVSSEEDLAKIKKIRKATATLISLGDCAINANVPSMRNHFKVPEVYSRGYIENADLNQKIPEQVIPPLLDKVVPVHAVVDVDLVIQGCPPPADVIHYALTELLEGRVPSLENLTRFGK